MMHPTTSLAAAAAIAAATLTLAACGSSGSGDDTTRTSTSAAASTASSALQGKHVVATTSFNGPPLTFLDADKKPTGYLVELERAAAEAAGATIDFQNTSFEATIPGVISGKYDIGTGIDATPERQKIIDVVPLIRAGYTFLVPRDGKRFKTMADLCGLRIATLAGHVAIPTLQRQSDDCRQAGKPGVTVLTFPDQATGELAVKSGHADAYTTYTGAAGYQVKHDPSWAVTGPSFGIALSGLALKKGTGVAQAWVAAIDKIIADGSYGKILARYGVPEVALTSTSVKPASSGQGAR